MEKGLGSSGPCVVPAAAAVRCFTVAELLTAAAPFYDVVVAIDDGAEIDARYSRRWNSRAPAWELHPSSSPKGLAAPRSLGLDSRQDGVYCCCCPPVTQAKTKYFRERYIFIFNYFICTVYVVRRRLLTLSIRSVSVCTIIVVD